MGTKMEKKMTETVYEKMKYPNIAKWLDQAYTREAIKHGVHNYTQSKFAKDTLIKPVTMSRLMQGYTRPNMDTALQIAEKYGYEFLNACDYPDLMPRDPIIREIVKEMMKLDKDQLLSILSEIRRQIE